jgi:hypothetical protein
VTRSGGWLLSAGTGPTTCSSANPTAPLHAQEREAGARAAGTGAPAAAAGCDEAGAARALLKDMERHLVSLCAVLKAQKSELSAARRALKARQAGEGQKQEPPAGQSQEPLEPQRA